MNIPGAGVFALIGTLLIGVLFAGPLTNLYNGLGAWSEKFDRINSMSSAPSAPSQAGYYEEAPRPRLRRTSFDDLPSDLPPGECQDPDTGVVYRC